MQSPSPRSTNATTVPQLILEASRRRGTAIRHYRDDAWRELSWAALGQIVREVAGGLIQLGVQPGERVAIMSNTRPEWVYADFGALCAGAVVIPIYQANSPEECEYVLAHSGARVVFCENGEQLAKVEHIRERLPALQRLVTFEDSDDGTVSLDELRSLGSEHLEQVDARASAIDPEDICTIPYTSGTTGRPRGCVISHRNCVANCQMCATVVDMGEHAALFVFLPLAHAMTRVGVMFAIDQGVELIFWRGDIRSILQDMLESRPTHFMSAPQLFEKIYAVATATGHERGALRRRVFDWAVASGVKARAAERAGRPLGVRVRARRSLADLLVLSRVRNLLGGRVRLALSGAAPIAGEILEFFDACGVVVVEGYGMTESTAMTTCNRPGGIRFGTVGQPVVPAEVRIADDGEVLMRGPHVFSGYYRDDRATRATLLDGWLYSGDLGEIDADGYLTITGRKKDILITSGGKNVSPSNIENMLRQSRWISHAVVYGERRPHLVALLTLDSDQAGALAERAGIEPDIALLARHPAVRAELQRSVEAVNIRLARAEQVRNFAILNRDLTQESGEITPTMKVRRSVVYERYGELLDSLYEGRAPSVADDQSAVGRPPHGP